MVLVTRQQDKGIRNLWKNSWHFCQVITTYVAQL